MSRLLIVRGTSTTARCEDCDELRPDSMRERVRQHVKRTGHTAAVVIEDRTTYYPVTETDIPARGNRRARTAQRFDREDTGEL